MGIDQLLNTFVRWLRLQGLSQRTARAYASDLRNFLEAVGGPGPSVLTPGRIAAYLDELALEGSAATTIARRLTSIRQFCRLLIERGVLPGDPTEAISVPIPDPEPVQWRREDVKAVVMAPDPHSVIGKRDRAIMVLLADTGMELQELCGLDSHNLSRDGERLIVGNGRRRRTVFLHDARLPLLRYWHDVRRDQPGHALFLSSRGTRISERAVQHRVRQYANAAGVVVSVGDLIERGRVRRANGNPAAISRALGCARSDAARRRYRVSPSPSRPAEEVLEHAFLKPLNGKNSGGIPRTSSAGPRQMTRADMWERLEREALQRAQLPTPPGKEWLAATRLVHLSPEERLRAYVKPAARKMAQIRKENQLGQDKPAAFQEAFCRSDSWLLKLHGRLVAISPSLSMWAKVQASSPEQRARTRRALEVSTDEPDLTEEILVWNAFGSPHRVLGWADTVLSQKEGQGVLWLLLRTRWDQLCWIRESASEYYGIPRHRDAQRELDAALVVACVAGLVICNPRAVERTQMSDAVAEPAAMYFLDSVTYVLRQLLWLLGRSGEAPGLADIDDDKVFAAAFEREWDALLQFTNGFFGFSVVPRFGYDDMVRYHRLRYAPHGDLTKMPYEVGDYLVHQAKASGHFLRQFLPERFDVVFFDYVRPLYDKLLRSFKYRARKALTQRHQDQDGTEVFARAEREIEAAFREAYDRYDFYQHPPGGPKTSISEGLLGWRRREDIRKLADGMGIGCEQSRTPFAAYARGNLQRMIASLCRESLAKQDDRGEKERDRKAPSRTGRVVQSPEGKYYRTIESLAHWVGRSASYLRDLDDVLEPVRVSDVFDGRHSNRKRLHDSTRLYPSDGESLNHYKELLREQHPRIAVEGLLTERQVASRLDVSVWWLRSRRERGLLEASRKGEFVVYNAKQRQAAERLLRTEMRGPHKKSE